MLGFLPWRREQVSEEPRGDEPTSADLLLSRLRRPPLVSAALVSSSIGVGFYFLHAGRGDFGTAVPLLVMGLLCLAVAVHAHLRGPFEGTSLMLSLVLLGSVMIATTRLGGFEGSTLLWLIPIPLVASLVGGRRLILLVTALSIAAVTAFYVLELKGVVYFERPAHVILVQREVDRVLVLAVVGSLVAVAHRRTRQVESRLVASHRDLEKRKRELASLALEDQLTGLENRHALNQFLSNAAEESSSTRRLGVIYIDLDRFSELNNSLGHSGGDAALESVAQRLTAFVSSDTRANVFADRDRCVSRVGGDEFVIGVVDPPAEEAVHLAAKQLCAHLRAPMSISGREVVLTASVGYALGEAASDAQALIARSDAAMLEAKRAGGDRVVAERDLENENHNRRFLHAAQLRRELTSKENNLRLVFQPIIEIDSASISDLEVLCRWSFGDEGEISPEIFVGLATQYGFSRDFDEWVLREALAHSRQLPLPLDQASLCVNVSPASLAESDWCSRVLRVISDSGVESSGLELEVTETWLTTCSPTVKRNLEEFRAHGLLVSLDDFGTGFSSLSHLREYPASRLKIDKSFVDRWATQSTSRLVGSIAAMGRSMGLEVVAEGVESLEQARWLMSVGCTHLQGYFFAAPAPLDQLEARLPEVCQAIKALVHRIHETHRGWVDDRARGQGVSTQASW